MRTLVERNNMFSSGFGDQHAAIEEHIAVPQKSLRLDINMSAS